MCMTHPVRKMISRGYDRDQHSLRRCLLLNLFPAFSNVLRKHDESATFPANLDRTHVVRILSTRNLHHCVCGHVHGDAITSYRFDAERLCVQPKSLAGEHTVRSVYRV